MASKVSKFEELKADRSYLEELKKKSEKERIRRQAGAKKLKEDFSIKMNVSISNSLNPL